MEKKIILFLTLCMLGEVLNSIDNCQTGDDNSCDECKDTFMRKKSGKIVCGKPITNCTEYDTASTTAKCKGCANGFELASDGLKCNKVTIDNCKYYSGTKCRTCNPGFLVNSNGKCDQIAEHCVSVENSQCSECEYGYYLTSTTPKSCTKGTVDNCDKYNSDGACTDCKEGYYLTSTTPKSCTKTVDNCKKYNTDGACTVCNIGYYLSSTTTCTKGTVDGCYVYYDNGTCCVCEISYYLSSTTCTKGTVDNCHLYNDDGTCYSCNEGYKKNNNACEKIKILYCDTYNGDNCKTCQDTHFLVDQYTCPAGNVANCKTYKEEVCTDCVKGYKIDTAKHTCKKDNHYLAISFLLVLLFALF